MFWDKAKRERIEEIQSDIDSCREELNDAYEIEGATSDRYLDTKKRYDDLTEMLAKEKGDEKPFDFASASGIIVALIGGLAAIGGALIQRDAIIKTVNYEENEERIPNRDGFGLASKMKH